MLPMGIVPGRLLIFRCTYSRSYRLCSAPCSCLYVSTDGTDASVIVGAAPGTVIDEDVLSQHPDYRTRLQKSRWPQISMRNRCFQLQAEVIVHGDLDLLLRPEDRSLVFVDECPKQKFDLLQIPPFFLQSLAQVGPGRGRRSARSRFVSMTVQLSTRPSSRSGCWR